MFYHLTLVNVVTCQRHMGPLSALLNKQKINLVRALHVNLFFGAVASATSTRPNMKFVHWRGALVGGPLRFSLASVHYIRYTNVATDNLFTSKQTRVKNYLAETKTGNATVMTKIIIAP